MCIDERAGQEPEEWEDAYEDARELGEALVENSKHEYSYNWHDFVGSKKRKRFDPLYGKATKVMHYNMRAGATIPPLVYLAYKAILLVNKPEITRNCEFNDTIAEIIDKTKRAADVDEVFACWAIIPECVERNLNELQTRVDIMN